MKKYLVLFFLLVSFTGFGQFINYTNINGRYKWIAGKFDSTFTLPSGTTPSLRVGGGTGPGALFYNTADSIVYQYTGSQWTPLRGSDTGRIQIAYVRNTTASQMTVGQVVYINGSTGNVPTVALANNKNDSSSAMTFGFVRGTIPVNGFGWITTFGPIDGINTNAYTEGEVIYLDSLSGQFTHTKPQAPYHMVTLGYIVKKAANGIIFTKIQNGYELEELHNVLITAPVLNKSVIIYDSVRSLWVDTTLSAAGMAVSSINTSSATGILGGPITTTGTISADTTLLSTRRWRQKGIDSLASIISTLPTGSGTTNYLSKWTGTSSLGNSLVFDNGTNVGIGITTSLTTPLTINTNDNNSYNGVLRLRAQNLTAGNAATFSFGRSNNAYDEASLSYIKGASNASARIDFNFNGSSTLMTIFGSGNMAVNSTTDAGYRLDVSGTFRSTLDANINGLTVGKGGGQLNLNTAFGVGVLNATNTGNGGNTAFGYFAIRSVTSGEYNVGVGAYSGQNISTGSYNLLIGRVSGRNITTGSNNVILGDGAAEYGSSAISGNTIVGTSAGQGSLTSSNNILVGFYSGVNLSSGAYNTFIGRETSAGNGITTGSFNTIIGSQITGLSSSLSNTIILADGQGNQRLYINSSGNVGIGTTSPAYKLDVNGTFRAVGTILSASNFFDHNIIGRIGIGNLFTSAGSDGMMVINVNGNTNNYALSVINGSASVIGGITSAGVLTSGTFKFGGTWNPASSGSQIGFDFSSRGVIAAQSTTLLIQPYATNYSNQPVVIGNNLSRTEKFQVDGTSYFTGSSILAATSGNVLIGTTTDAGYKLDVNGTARVQNNSGLSLLVGSNASFTATATPVVLSLGGTYGTTAAGNSSNLKLRIYDAGDANSYFGLGVSSNLFELQSSVDFAFFTGSSAARTERLRIKQDGAVGIGTTSPNASALLDVSSTTKGFLPPRMTGTQAEAIATPAAGLLVYINNGNGTTITSIGWWGYDGTNWVKINP